MREPSAGAGALRPAELEFRGGVESDIAGRLLARSATIGATGPAK